MTAEVLTKMKPSLKSEWSEALRSGKYSQAHEALCDGEGYCCLGVLLDIAAPDEWVADPCSPGAGCVHTVYCANYLTGEEEKRVTYNGGELSNKLLTAFGLDQVEAETLMVMNDSGEYDFKDIALYIDTGVMIHDSPAE